MKIRNILSIEKGVLEGKLGSWQDYIAWYLPAFGMASLLPICMVMMIAALGKPIFKTLFWPEPLVASAFVLMLVTQFLYWLPPGPYHGKRFREAVKESCLFTLICGFGWPVILIVTIGWILGWIFFILLWTIPKVVLRFCELLTVIPRVGISSIYKLYQLWKENPVLNNS